MNRNIKPIETVYNGYRFRSRLEARWAVFFDTLGIEYEYEPEGYDLGECGYYLPDFYVKTPEGDFWLEVKRTGWEPTDSDHTRYVAFWEGLETYIGFYVVAGDPYPGSYVVYRCQQKEWYPRPGPTTIQVRSCKDAFTICPLCKTVGLRAWIGSAYGGNDVQLSEMWSCDYCDHIDRSHPHSDYGYFHEGLIIADPGFFQENAQIMAASTTARQARFEHGEAG